MHVVVVLMHVRIDSRHFRTSIRVCLESLVSKGHAKHLELGYFLSGIVSMCFRKVSMRVGISSDL